ncbi:MAG: hypothetical protein R3E84_19115 [Pseudomonadales bacterium]
MPGSCSECHNNVNATGKPALHLPTAAACDDCHSTVAWLPARFDHAGIAGNCVACHDGAISTGKNPTHINTSNVCENCPRWLRGYR